MKLYNGNGEITGGETYLKDGTPDDKVEYALNSKKKMVMLTHFAPGGMIRYKGVSRYNENGIEVERVKEPWNMFGKAFTWYDDNHNLIEDICYNKDGSVYKHSFYHYEFDSQGNWIEMERIENRELVQPSFRDVDYYY